MKMILRISPSRQSARRMLEHIYGQGDYQAERFITDRRGECRYKLEAGYPTLDAKFDAGLLLARHHGKGKEARHIIFSGEEMPNASEADYRHALDAVVAAAVDFAANEAPDHDYIIVPHIDRHHPHCHMVMSASDGQRCIDWDPKDLVRFQGLAFLRPETQHRYQLLSGRGRGKRPAGVGRVAYSSAVSNQFHATKEHTLAESLDYERILQAISTGKLVVSRKTKSGKPLSVILNGKVVRLSTIRKAAAANPGSAPDDSGAAQSAAQSPGHAQRRASSRPQRRTHRLVRG